MPERLGDENILGAIEEMSDDEIYNYVEVTGPAGGTFKVMGDEEASWYQTSMQNYQDQYKFENVADTQDLERLIGLELLSYRYAVWLIAGMDYEGQIVDEKAIRDHKEKIDREIRLVKDHMGMGRKNRLEDERQNTSDFLRDLLDRAKQFGVHRDNQIAKAMDLMSEVKKLVGLHDRCDEEERVELGVSQDQIIGWLRDVGIPEYDLLDDHFRTNQKLWIRDIA